MHTGWLGAIIGACLGLLGGIIGSYFSIKNTNGPRERAFMIKANIIAWVAMLIFLTLMFIVPAPYTGALWIPYGILLPLGIIKFNKTQQKIRKAEAGEP